MFKLLAHVMYDLAIKLNSTERLVETLHLLNYLLRNSPSNFHAKLLCLQIFHILGCSLGAHKIYMSLDVKHVQLDSLGYLHCAHLPITGIISYAKPIYDQTLKFFTASYKDSLEYLAMSYKFGSFSKLQEFMDFRERLSNSIHYSTISVEALIQEIVCFNGTTQQNFVQFQNMKIEPNEDRIKYEELMDNRDLDVMIRWDPSFRYTSDNGEPLQEPIPIVENSKSREKESFVQDIELLQIRSSLLRLVAASVELIYSAQGSSLENIKEQNGQDSSSIEDAGESFKQLMNSWIEIFNLGKKLNHQQSSSEFLVNLLPSRLFFMIKLPYEEVFTSLSRFVYHLWIGSEKAKDSSAELLKGFTAVKTCVDALVPIEKTEGIFEYRNLQGSIVCCVEVKYIKLKRDRKFTFSFI
jgi:N-terminal acetyltransferase B complex non-catalytic subunit